AMPLDELTGRIDCIVYDGSLERMHDPLAVLRRHALLLAPDGMMLIKAANASHWRVAARALLNDIDSEDEALETPPPLLFTLDRLRTALLGLGLWPCDVTLDESDDGEARAFVDAMAPSLSGLGVDPEDYAGRAIPAHYIWRVRRSAGERLVVSGSMLEPVGGVSHVRVVHPLAAVGSDPLARVAVIEQIDGAPAPDDTPRIFVLHRPALTRQQGPAILRALRASGYLIVTEFDDHPDFFHMMRHGGELSFRGVHAVQTSTPVLANVLRQYNPEVAIFPNAMATLPPVQNYGNPDQMTLFFGALNRESCWQPLMEVINTVARMAGPRLKFQIVHDRMFFDALDTPHKSFTPTCDYETYLHLLGSSEICFMPLSDTTFNRAKSDLKFIECGACRVAAVASTVVYGDSVEHGRTGMLFRDPRQLYDVLLRLLAAPELARAMGDSARHYVETERMLAYQVAPRIAWYRSLWQRRAELTAALDARMAAAMSAAA
ncbi:MAG: glycosyltransferase, partial [Proteobacteria bacterium]|nr:glycosyltransferase [Pseudomonadota bacterium]